MSSDSITRDQDVRGVVIIQAPLTNTTVNLFGNITDTNATTECPANEFLDGDGDCRTAVEIVTDGGGTTDTNATTACGAGEFLDGNGLCVEYSPFNATSAVVDSSNFTHLNRSNTFEPGFNITLVTGWFFGLFDWIINPSSDKYLSFNGTTLDFNETQLNNTITNIATGLGGNLSFNQTLTDELYPANISDIYSTFNATYAANDSSLYSTYNATYDNFAHNETLAGDGRFVNEDGDNMTGPLDMGNNNITSIGQLRAADGSAIRFGANGNFVGFDQAIVIQTNQTLGEGVITHALLDNQGDKVIEVWQSGKNNSAGFHRNSYLIFGDLNITNASILTNAREMWATYGINSFMNYDTAGQGAALGVQYGIETQKIFIHDELGNGQFLMDGGDFRVVSSGGNDIDFYEGAVHIQDQEIRQVGEVGGVNLTVLIADFTSGLTPFVLTTSGKGTDEWATTPNGNCPTGSGALCAHAGPTGGSGDTIMQVNFSAANLELNNLSFNLNTNNLNVAGNFNVTINNNTGSGDVSLYQLNSTDVSDDIINVSIEPGMDNQSLVSMNFIFSSSHPILGEVWVDNVQIDGMTLNSLLINQTFFDGQIEFGTGVCNINVNGTDNSMTFGGIGCGELIFQGNTTFENVNVQDQNVTGDITATGNVTIGGWFNGLFNWTTISNYLSFNGATLTLDDANLVTDFNQTQIIIDNNASWLSTFNETYSLLNSTYGANWYNHSSITFDEYGIWWNNQTTPAITYTDNALVLSNSSWLSTFNISYAGALSNSSYLSTFNATYDLFAYNQTNEGDFVQKSGDNMTGELNMNGNNITGVDTVASREGNSYVQFYKDDIIMVG